MNVNETPQIVTLSDVVEPGQEQGWERYSAQVYERMLRTGADHLVVRVRQRFRLESVVRACGGFRQYTGGAGQPATYPVVRLCWALLLRGLYSWSYRKTEEAMRENLVVRWCTHCALQEETPDHSTLCRFEQWVRKQGLDVMFVAVLEQIDEDFPDEARVRQCGDTYGMRANVADVSLTTLLRRSCRQVLMALEAALPGAYVACVEQAEWKALFGAGEEREDRQVGSEERERQTVATAQAAARWLTVIRAVMPAYGGGKENARLEKLVHWCGVVEKILTDEFTDVLPAPSLVPSQVISPPTGVQSASVSQAEAPVVDLPVPAAAVGGAIRRCTAQERGSYRIISATDTDATIRKHGDTITLGYNVAVLATRNFVRGIRAYTGATPDGSTIAPLLAQHQARFGFCPERCVYDRATGTPKHMADVRRMSAGQTQLVARQIGCGVRHSRYTLVDFSLGPVGLTCPNGVLSTQAYRAGDGDGYYYRYTAQQCRGCPLRERCRDPKSKLDSHRTVFLSDHALLHSAELAYLSTPAAHEDFAFRANIERHIAALVLHNGARRANVCGLAKVNAQVTMAAIGYNLKRWHTLTLQQERQGRKAKPPCPASLYPPP
jgi:IS5 family transposase